MVNLRAKVQYRLEIFDPNVRLNCVTVADRRRGEVDSSLICPLAVGPHTRGEAGNSVTFQFIDFKQHLKHFVEHGSQ